MTRLQEDPLDAAVGQLTQLAALVGLVGPDDYAVPHRALHGSTIGQHVRHCLDHFDSFARGVSASGPDCEIDYDARPRDPRIEVDPAAAGEHARALAIAVRAAVADRGIASPVAVRCACGESGEITAQASSLGRELQFLVSHTVHHLAMISAMCRELDVAVDDAVGVAPSTLRHRARTGGRA
ncbi:MAG: DinB family protein [Planctomycetes bacterium]|nr:DinB family protein [Planctomycetota bacterium]